MREQLQEQERREAELRQSLQQQRPVAATPKPVPGAQLTTIGVDVPPQVLQLLTSNEIKTRSKSAADSLIKSTNRSPLTLNLASVSTSRNRKTSTKNSSVSCNKSVTSSPSTPISPVVINSPLSDNVFSPLTIPTMTEPTELPKNWNSMSTDEKLTSMMTILLSSNEKVFKKLDAFGKQIDQLQANFMTNATSITKLEIDLDEFKKETIANSARLSNEVSKLKIDQAGSSNLKAPLITSDLLISGIPDSIDTKFTPLEVSSAIFDKLAISHLINEILTVRKLENNKLSSINNDSNRPPIRPLNNSYMIRMKS
ncbi:hypothetical protein KQX54_015338, partial [Cotesia glomerata]